jgi:hypothetical protein
MSQMLYLQRKVRLLCSLIGSQRQLEKSFTLMVAFMPWVPERKFRL